MADGLAYEPGGDPDGLTGDLSDLAQLRKDAEEYAPEQLRYVHPTLPQYTLIFRRSLDLFTEMQVWRKKCVIRAERQGRPEEIDQEKFGRMVISGVNTGIERNGTPVVDSAGDPVTFRSREFQGAFGVGTAADAVKAFIRSDSAIAALSTRIVDDCGVGQDVEAAVDPTVSDGS